MAVRPDVFIRWALSPRVVVVEAPSVELTIQDLVDTTRELEDDLANVDDPGIISASGKEDLGGGTKVGVTAKLLDAVISFEARKTWISAGTATEADALGRTLVNATATFVDDGVAPGAWVLNATDLSICSVIRVVSQTTLLTDDLGGGVDNEWGIGDVYRVLPVIGCEVSGGNVVAVDKYSVPIAALLPTAGTQVTVARSVSATTQEQADIEFSSFNGAVTVDVVNGVSGTAFPIGTERRPVNNLAHAKVIAEARGFNRMRVKGDLLLDAGGTYDGYIFEGESMTRSTFTVTTAASVIGCAFHRATVNGVLDGGCTIEWARIDQLEYVDGYLISCVFAHNALVTLSGANQATILDCWSDAANEAEAPTINCGGAGSELVVRNFAGQLKITNKTGPEYAAISILNGHVFIEATVSAGKIEVSGSGFVTDEHTGTAEVETYELVNTVTIQQAVEQTTAQLKFMIESHRAGHAAFGNAFYWDPVGGDDLNSGTLPSAPRKTFASIHDELVTDGNRDVVFVIGTTEPTTVTERITISKRYTFLRGPGRDVVFAPTEDGGPTITITAHGVEVSAVKITTMQGGAAVDGIYASATASHLRLVNLDMFQCTGRGVAMYAGRTNTIEHCIIHNCGAAGVYSQNSLGMILINSTVINNGDYGVKLVESAGTHLGSVIDNSIVKWNNPKDLSIGAGVFATVVRGNSTLDPAQVDSAGTWYYNETAAQLGTIADAVWEEPIVGHSTADTTGYLISLLRKALTNRLEASPGNPGSLVLYDDDALTPLLNWATRDDAGAAVVAAPGAPGRRGAAT